MEQRPSQALQRVDGARFAVRRRVLRRRHLDRRLLPADLPGEDAKGGQLPLLRHGPGGRARRLPPMPAVPPGAGAGQCAGRRCAADCAADRAAARGGTPRREGGARGDCGPVRAQLATDPADRPERARSSADPTAADAPPAARQAAPDRDDVADDRGRVRQRLFEPAPLQRRVQQAVWDAADASAQEGDRWRRRDRGERDLNLAALVSSAVRLGGSPRRFSRRAR